MIRRKSRIRVAIAAIALGLGGCATLSGGSSADFVSVVTTSRDQTRLLQALPDIQLESGQVPSGDAVITVDPAWTGQSMVGFGAAMTDASAIVLRRLPDAARKSAMNDLFGVQGLAIAFVRVPIGASDFSAEHYSLADTPKGQRDDQLTRFSLDVPRQHQIPALREARAINPSLTLMASPWSAPAWMKTTDSLIKGQLRPDAYPAFARYFVRYLDAMQDEGLPVRYISVQNEPDFEPADYPGMRFNPADRARFLKDALGPALARRGQPVGVLDYDHNWDRPQDPLAVLADKDAARYVSGVAWHCYGGKPEAMEQVRIGHPDKDVFFTECSGGAWAPDWGDSLEWMTDNLIIAPTRYGSRGSLLWNLALDEKNGPHRGGCGNCRGVLTIDSRTGAVTRNVEYYVLGQVSRFVRPGSVRVASDGGGPVRHVAFRTPDRRLVLLAHNASKGAVSVSVRIGQQGFAASMPAGEVMTFTWNDRTARR